MSRKHGFELLARQSADLVEADVNQWSQYWDYGDTPIEKLFSLALQCVTSYSVDATQPIVRVKIGGNIDAFLTEANQFNLVMERQVQIGSYRVDFVIHSFALGGNPKTPRGWHRLIVECDGHDFHERTKEQAARDRSRDRDLSLKEFTVFRFTGSELWRNPIKCAKDVTDWAAGLI